MIAENNCDLKLNNLFQASMINKSDKMNTWPFVFH